MVHFVDAVFVQHLGDGLAASHIQRLVRPGIPQRRAGRCRMAGRHDVGRAVARPQGHGQFRADLSNRPVDENLFQASTVYPNPGGGAKGLLTTSHFIIVGRHYVSAKKIRENQW